MILAPLMIQAGEIAPRISPSGAVIAISRNEIVNQWSLWSGVTMMVVGSIVSLFARSEIFTKAFKTLGFGKTENDKKEVTSGQDLLRNIEVPLWIS